VTYGGGGKSLPPQGNHAVAHLALGGDLPGRSGFLTSAVTAIMAAVAGLTFLFGFDTVLSLGSRLGVSVWVAPPVAPAVDLSILGPTT
jgi:hypothetical protein